MRFKHGEKFGDEATIGHNDLEVIRSRPTGMGLPCLPPFKLTLIV